MTRKMYDSTNPNAIPTNAQLVAGYLAPSPYAWTTAAWARFPNSVKVQIAVRASTNAGQVLDVESGDATAEQAPGWVTMRRAAGQDPTVYCSEGSWGSVQSAFASQNVAQPHYWVAAYPGGGAVIPVGAVAHQYADPSSSGGDWDLSIVADFWPGVDGVTVTGPVDIDLNQALTEYKWTGASQTGSVGHALGLVEAVYEILSGQGGTNPPQDALATIGAQLSALTTLVNALPASLWNQAVSNGTLTQPAGQWLVSPKANETVTVDQATLEAALTAAGVPTAESVASAVLTSLIAAAKAGVAKLEA